MTKKNTMAQNTKLELTWIGKGAEHAPFEPRILVENEAYSYGEIEIGTLPNGKPWNGNMLIHGDNLLALKALEQQFGGCVKCICIDPPYNTGNAFEHYDDGIEHSLWLDLMQKRLQLLKNLLKDDGVIFINIDDDECHYLKILCDEVFGRKNFCGSFIWEKKRKPSFLNSQLGTVTEYILSYAKCRDKVAPFAIGTTSETETYPLYNAGNSRGVLTFPPGSVHFLAHKDGEYAPQEFREDTSNVVLKNTLNIKEGVNQNTISLEGEWRYGQSSIDEQIANGDYYIIKSLKFRPRRVFERSNVAKKMHNLLSRAHYDMATYEDAAKESLQLFGEDAFSYPKPEQLIYTLLEASTNENDLVLDSFVGSGTTAAVAHKLHRKYIGIELGEHAYTHCFKRLKKIVDNDDKGGISPLVNWEGGGGFKFYELAPSLLKKDSHGHLVINKEYNPDMLAAAMAKMEGFVYEPSEDTFWKQGHSSESDYIFTTTQFVTVESLGAILDTMADGESLLVCCKAFQPECKNFSSRISVKKIPAVLLGRCEFDHDDYSLNIIELPQMKEDVDSDVDEGGEDDFRPTLF